MEKPTPRPRPMYPGELTDGNICHIFRDAGDFIHRVLTCGEAVLYAYMIDGLVSGGDASEYIFKPITEHLRGGSMEELYDRALGGRCTTPWPTPARIWTPWQRSW